MRPEPYGVAYSEARSELLDITSRYEQLKLRRAKLEKMIAVVGPFLGSATQIPVVVEPTAEAKPSEAESPSEPLTYSFEKVPVPLPSVEETGGDPFQRRVRHALQFRSIGQGQRGLQTAV
jgi:hypothetical protein